MKAKLFDYGTLIVCIIGIGMNVYFGEFGGMSGWVMAALLSLRVLICTKYISNK